MPRIVKKIESGMFFRRLPFVRLTKQIIQELGEFDVHVSKKALRDIQDVTETYVASLMDRAKLAVGHGLRQTLRRADIDLVQELAQRPSHEFTDVEESPRPSRVRPKSEETSSSSSTTARPIKIYRDNEEAISVPGIQRAAVEAGIVRVRESVYKYMRTTIVIDFMKELLTDAVASAKFNRRYTIKQADVVDAAKRHSCL
jgi:histone H3/H4